MITENTERSAFIEQNLGLVHSCAGRFRGRGIEYDDLYSACLLYTSPSPRDTR